MLSKGVHAHPGVDLVTPAAIGFDMDKQRVVISFPGRTGDVAGRLAEDLAKDIKRSVKDDGRPVEATVTRSDKSAMDFGSVLVLALGTPAITILARAVLEWAKRTNSSTLELNGVRVDKLESRDVAAIVAALNHPSRAGEKE